MKRSQKGHLYIIETADKSLVKVGFTRQLRKRIVSHRSVSIRFLGPIKLVGVAPSTAKRDAAILRSLNWIGTPVRMRSDWFYRDREVDAFVASIKVRYDADLDAILQRPYKAWSKPRKDFDHVCEICRRALPLRLMRYHSCPRASKRKAA